MSARRHDLAVVGLFAVLAVIHTWPLAEYMSRAFVRHPDVFANMWALNELARAVVSHPLRLFEGNIFYPYAGTLAVHDHHIANLLVSVPLRLFTQSPVLVYNVVLLISFVLSGFFTYKLVERLTRHRVGAFVAGCTFAFSAYRFTHYIHLHLLTTQWLPLVLLTLDWFYERPTWARLAGLTAAGLLLATSSWQMAMMGATAALIVAVWSLVGDSRPIGRRVGLGLVGVLVVGLALSPVAAAYLRMSEWHVGTGPADVHMRALSVMSVPIEGLWTPGDHSRQPYLPLDRSSYSEARMSPGIATFALAAVGLLAAVQRRRQVVGTLDRLLRAALWTSIAFLAASIVAAGVLSEGAAVLFFVRRGSPVQIIAAVGAMASLRRVWLAGPARDERPAIIYATLAVAGAMLCLGPTVLAWHVNLGSGVLRTDLIPGLFRVPGRFAVVMFFGLAVLAGLGTARLLRGRSGLGGMLLAGVVVCGVNLDLWPRLPLLEFSPTRRAVHRWLDEYPEPGAIIEYPYSEDMAIFASLTHGRRLVNGVGVAEPPGVTDLREPEAFTPSHIETIWEYLHPRFVVFRGSLYPEADRSSRLALIEARPDVFRLLAGFGVDRIYELVDRGTGPTLRRRWPKEALVGRTALQLQLHIVDVPAGAEPMLAVDLNDEPHLRLAGPRLLTPERYPLAFTPDELVRGLNTFEIRADYRRPEGPLHEIGTSETATRLDIQISSTPDLARVQVNGHVFEVDKGYLLLALDGSGTEVARVGAFNTSWLSEDARRLASFVDSLPEGTVVIVASEFDVSRHLDAPAVAALGRLGLAADLRNGFGWAHAAIGVKGAPAGSVLEVIGAGGAAELTLGSPARPAVQLSSVDLY